MKKFICVAGALLLLSVAVQAGILEVSIAQTTGVTASYNGTSKILNWDQGTSGLIVDEDWGVFEFGTATVSAEFSGVTDLSSGGVAKATFSTGSWSMDLSDITNTTYGVSLTGATVHLAGGISGLYTEQELPEGDALDGRAVVTLTSANFSGFGTEFSLLWGNSGMLGGMISSIVFPPDTNIQDYQTSYLSQNVTITLLSDHTAIPEPVTMLLLGLGAVLLRKKK
jgi:hypothetical protein